MTMRQRAGFQVMIETKGERRIRKRKRRDRIRTVISEPGVTK
jgi:hypothetical protein